MKLQAKPGRPLQGVISQDSVPVLPGDKSLSHRAAIVAALAEGESRIENFLEAGVTRSLLEALAALGVSWQIEGTSLLLQGRGFTGWRAPGGRLDCRNSATTMRLLAGALAACGIPAILDGTPSLRLRPMQRIVSPLQAMGVAIEAAEGGVAPLRIAARQPDQALHPIDYNLPLASAQVKSCLLLAALGASGPTTLYEPGPSRDHTERMLRLAGVSVVSERLEGVLDPHNFEPPTAYRITVTPPSPLRLAPLRLSLPVDFSSAAFLIVAALIVPGSQISLYGVGLNPTRTGLLDALSAMGADIQVNNYRPENNEPSGDLVVRYSRLQGTQVSGSLVVRMIDEFPAFAVAAAFAAGPSLVYDAQELRHKESDRISALCQELNHLGLRVDETPGGFAIAGGQVPTGGMVDPHGDHRLAMALAVSGLAAREPVIVQGAEIVQESFPRFVEVLQHLDADINLEA